VVGQMRQSGVTSRAEFSEGLSTEWVIASVGVMGLTFAIYCEFVSAPTKASAFALIMLAVSFLAWQLDNWRDSLGKWFTILVTVGLLLLANGWLGVSLAPALLAIPTALATLTIGVPAAAGLALAETALLTLMPRYVGVDLAPVSRFFVVLSIWAAFGMAYHVPQRERRLWAHVQRSQSLVEEARSRKAELEQAREDWANVSRQLALANERLTALRLIAEEARKSKAAFVAKVSHEFRTPLNIIIGMVNLMVETPEIYGGPFPLKALEQLQIVHRNCQHLASMIDDVLDLSQVEAGRMTLHREHVDLAHVIETAVAVVKPLIDEKGLDLRVAVPDDLPAVYCDRTRIRQVFLNLLSNGARLTAEGGITVAAEQKDGRVIVSVTDTGPGISPEDAQRIFEPFQRGQNVRWQGQGGSGLGLSISRQFVQLHGGRMWLESEPGAGTTFYVELPVSEPAEHVARPERWVKRDWVWVERSFRTDATRLADRPLKPRVVVCDEAGGLCDAFAHHSDQAQFVDVRDLSEAIQELRRSPAHALVLNTPSSNRTLSLVEAARREVQDTPIIGCCVPPKLEHALKAGAMGYLTKPVKRAELSGAIEAVGRPVRRILILDDEADARELLTFYVHAHGGAIEVATAESGEQALRELRRDPPDLALIDILMPDMDGWQVLAAKAQDEAIRDIPAVIVSAQDPREGPTKSALLVATIGDGLSINKLLSCCRDLSAMLLQPG